MPMIMRDSPLSSLFISVILREWREVARIYKENPNMEVQGMRFTHSGYTALHIAASEKQDKELNKLVQLMVDAASIDVMRLADDRGNTPLHLAAKMGNAGMCVSIASTHPDTMGERNNDGETPLFLAALHGMKNAFFALCYYCSLEEEGNIFAHNPKIFTFGRRNTDGRTVLHCAIDGEYFDLGYLIINHYGEFVHCIDERGNTPLHLLASNPSAFRSSSRSRFTLLQKIIYHCIPAEKPKWERNFLKLADTFEQISDRDDLSSNDEENPPERKSNSQHNYRWLEKLYYKASSFMKGLLMTTIALLNYGLSWKMILFPKRLLKLKTKHQYFVKIVNELVEHTSPYDYKATGSEPTSRYEIDATFDFSVVSDQNRDVMPHIIFSQSHWDTSQDNQKKKGDQDSYKSNQKKKRKIDTPIIIATKNGIGEIVKDILNFFPMAIHDMNSEGKNLMLLAVENRQLHIYKLLQDGNHITNNLFDYVDDNGNSVLHLAAILSTDRPWLDPSVVLQMQWEVKWYEFIKNSVPKYLLNYQNDRGKTPEETFREEHRELVKSDTEWLNKASESCTIVATLMATVAFATSANVPGGVNGKNGEPNLKQQRMFEVFAISSLVALCFSLTAVVMFLSILTSRHQIMDFGTDLPRKFLIGLTALFISMASMLVSFCGGHFFVLRGVLRNAWIAEYLVVFLPITIFTMAQLPLYTKLVFGIIKKVPGNDLVVSN
ncbi:unnamed protein product [Camellia sinensis]